MVVEVQTITAKSVVSIVYRHEGWNEGLRARPLPRRNGHTRVENENIRRAAAALKIGIDIIQRKIALVHAIDAVKIAGSRRQGLLSLGDGVQSFFLDVINLRILAESNGRRFGKFDGKTFQGVFIDELHLASMGAGQRVGSRSHIRTRHLIVENHDVLAGYGVDHAPEFFLRLTESGGSY